VDAVTTLSISGPLVRRTLGRQSIGGGIRMADQIAWVEVVGSDGEKLRDFYGNLFGWSYQQAPRMPYWMYTPDGAVGAGVGTGPEGAGHATFYVAVDDPQAALDKVAELGGQTVVPVTEMEMVTFAMFTDPEGHLVGIVKNQPPA
jgi:predicted enzyme related to lactoylglutathione lyase